MNKKAVFAVLGAVSALASSAFASEDPTILAERTALKPGPGLFVVDSTLSIRVGQGSVKDKKGISHPGGWTPTRIEMDLWGKSDTADALKVNWKNGNKVVGTTDCETPEISGTSGDDQKTVYCDIKEGPVFPKVGKYDFEITYTVAGKAPLVLRKGNFTVRNYVRGQELLYYVDLDYKLAENVAYWDWSGSNLVVRTHTKQKSDFARSEGKLRCTVDGQPLGVDGSVQAEGAGNAQQGVDDSVTMLKLEGAVFSNRKGGKWKPGKYECQFVMGGKIMRVARFQLAPNLAIVTSPEQTGAGAFVSRTTLLTDIDIPAGIDLPFDVTALQKQAFLGRPWTAGGLKLPPKVGGAYKAPPALTAPKKK